MMLYGVSIRYVRQSTRLNWLERVLARALLHVFGRGIGFPWGVQRTGHFANL